MSFDQISYHYDGANEHFVPRKAPKHPIFGKVNHYINVPGRTLSFQIPNFHFCLKRHSTLRVVALSQRKSVFLISGTFWVTFNSILKTKYYTVCVISKSLKPVARPSVHLAKSSFGLKGPSCGAKDCSSGQELERSLL